jgi:hypothetical protein
MADLLEQHGDETLQTYTGRFFDYQAHPLQAPDDLIEAAAKLTEELLGREISERLTDRLNRCPVILTANHHGPDYLSLTVQGDVLFSLPETADSVVPVFAFGGVPLNNLSWGRGIRLSDGGRVNLFPDRLKSTMVGTAPAFDREMVERANGKLDTPSPLETDQVRVLLEEDYLAREVLAEETYSRQSTILNHRIWRRLSAGSERPEMVYLEIEALAAEVIGLDLADSESLMYRVLCDPELRNGVLEALEGRYGCWSRSALVNLQDTSLDGARRRALSGSAGTTFFWGVDARGRRIPLLLEDETLHGVDDSGNPFSASCTPEVLVEALREGRLYPSLFTTFTAVAFARGFRCYGGFMQADYLTEMKLGLVSALDAMGQTDWSASVQQVLTENYVTGLIFAVTRDRNGVRPSGAVDLIASGGLSAAMMETVRERITVEEASLMGLPEVYRMVCHDALDPELSAVTPEDLLASSGGSLVVVGQEASAC